MLYHEDRNKQQRIAAHAVITQNIPFLILEVNRDHLLENTIMTIERVEAVEGSESLRRPLRVKFQGTKLLSAVVFCLLFNASM